jgi:flagellar biosynthesis protein FlhB
MFCAMALSIRKRLLFMLLDYFNKINRYLNKNKRKKHEIKDEKMRFNE